METGHVGYVGVSYDQLKDCVGLQAIAFGKSSGGRYRAVGVVEPSSGKHNSGFNPEEYVLRGYRGSNSKEHEIPICPECIVFVNKTIDNVVNNPDASQS